MPGGVEQTNSREMLDLAESQLLHEKGSPERTLFRFGLLLIAVSKMKPTPEVAGACSVAGSWRATVSMTIPGNVIEVDDPSVLWVAIGTPRLQKVDVANESAEDASAVFGSPTNKKISR